MSLLIIETHSTEHPGLVYFEPESRLSVSAASDLLRRMSTLISQKNIRKFTLIVRNEGSIDSDVLPILQGIKRIAEANQAEIVMALERTVHPHRNYGLRSFETQRDADLYHLEVDQRVFFQSPTS